ncbi:hypothetical protein HYX02_07095 [Candidatus Woesearchaeota archaeon]|nr:hypothetical protein [Candidatus Woesearchaeota archaeon]
MGAKVLIYLLLGIFLISSVNAATIYGTVYDLSLKKINNARVEINTSPKQVFVTQNGSYSFNVPNGFYTIKAQLIQKNTVIASVKENITIKQPGEYVLDLILFPDVEEGVEEIDFDVNEDVLGRERNGVLIVFVVLVVLLAGIGFYYFRKIRSSKEEIKEDKIIEKEEQKDDLEQIIKIIKQEGGRATQKEIRKQIPLSEAKISLMIAELEHKGFIEKIKKGRGNIILLKKR